MDEGFCIKAPRGGYVGGGTKCGRWNPTAEQVKVLTELFRSGLRTPSTDQIQKISSQLSYYGKIESKNVFYWFQNHKARERQKRRRVSVDHDHDQKENHYQDKIHSSLRIDISDQTLNHEAVSEPAAAAAAAAERVIETLQLFPLNSFSETETENNKQLRFFANDCKGMNTTSSFGYTIGAGDHHHHHHHLPTLDLRLSFMS